MIAELRDDDKKYIHLKYDSTLEEEQMLISFTKKIQNWRFRTKGQRWNGDVKFMKGRNQLPIGLWKELVTECKRFGFKLQVKGLDTIINKDVDRDLIFEFCRKLTAHLPFEERESQMDAVYKAIKYKYNMLCLATSAGKTLIEYMIIFYLFYTKQITKVLIVCPDADLVIQGYQDFLQYAGGKYDLKMAMVHGESSLKDISEYRIIIGNFQTLNNRDASFFEDIDCLIVDECHRAKSQSIQQIFETISGAKYRIGLSGTIPQDKKTADYFQLMATLGPIVKVIKKKELMDSGYATKVDIQVFKLNYASEKARKWLAMKRNNKSISGADLFKMEQQMVRSSKVRMEWVTNLISKLKGNTLVFFIDKEGGYGREIVQRLKRKTSGKEIYYIDGDTKKTMREAIKEKMEEGDNKILVASYQTYSTGKSIKNLHNVVCAESMKSEIVIGQGMGRGMRQHESKDKFLWIDVVDDLSYDHPDYGKRNLNFMIKHYHERRKLYESEGFDYKVHDVDLMNMSYLDLIED